MENVIKKNALDLPFFFFVILLASTSLFPYYTSRSNAELSSSNAMTYSFVTRWSNDFRSPQDIALDLRGAFVYVVDSGNNRIQKFDSNRFDKTAIPIERWGSFGSGNGQFKNPLALAVDSISSSVLVVDSGNNRIQKFDGNGVYQSQWGSRCVISVSTSTECVDPDGQGPLSIGDGQFFSPGGIAIDRSGNVYIADSQNNRIQKFDSNGNFINKWGSVGISNGKFRLPADIAVDPSGTFVYVADKNNNRIQKFDSNGNFIKKWGSLGGEDGQFNYPLNIAVDPSGTFVYVADSGNNRIQKFDSNGVFLTKWGSGCIMADGTGCEDPDGPGPLNEGDGQFNSASGVNFDPSGTFVYVADSGNNRVQVFNPDLFQKTMSLTMNSQIPSSHSNSQPKMVMDGNNVYLAWDGINAEGNHDIYFRRSTDGGATFDKTINLSNNSGQSSEVQIAASGSNVYVVWTNSPPDAVFANPIFFSKSTDGGATFGQPITLGGVQSSSRVPQLAISGDNVYVVWQSQAALCVPVLQCPKSEISFSKSTDGGATFGQSQRMSNTVGSSISPKISASGSNVYVVWTDDTPGEGNSDVFFRSSLDNGTTFSNNIDISGRIGQSSEVQIAASGSNVYVVWTNSPLNFGFGNPIFFSKSTDGGATFSAPIALDGGTFSSRVPQLAISGDNVYVVWQSQAELCRLGFPCPKSEISFSKSTDGGATFGQSQRMSNTVGSSISPKISASGSNVYVVWTDDTPGNNEIFLKRSTDGGTSFSNMPVNLSNNAGNSIDQQTIFLGNDVHVIWTDNVIGEDSDILLATIEDGSDRHSGIINLSETPNSQQPLISLFDNNVYAIWQDYTPGSAGNPISFSKSTDGGATFSAPLKLSNDSQPSLSPRLNVSDSNNVYLAWDGINAEGNHDIYFRRSTDGGATFDKTINLSNNSGQSSEVQIAASGSNVYVVWTDDTPGNNEIFLKRSTDGGATFGEISNLSQSMGVSKSPKITISAAAGANNTYVTWIDSSSTNNEGLISFSNSTDGGATFSEPQTLSLVDQSSTNPQMSASGSNVYVVWEAKAIGCTTDCATDIYFRRSTDTGNSFSNAVKISDNDGIDPYLISLDNNVYVTWTSPLVGNGDIIYRNSSDNGGNFDHNINISTNIGQSSKSIISLSGNNVSISWIDTTTGNQDIYFRKSPDSGGTFDSTINLSNNVGVSENLGIAASNNGTIYLIWEDNTLGNKEILLKRTS